jgi:hypothetical protein
MTRRRSSGAKTTRMALAVAALATATSAGAQTGPDLRLWTTVTVQGRAAHASPWRWRADSLARTRGGAGTLDFLAEWVMVTRDLTQRSGAGLGYAYGVAFPEAGELREHRLVEQYTWSGGGDWRVSLRSRLEERFVTGQEAVRLRVRQQARVSWPLTRRLRGTVSEELLLQANSAGQASRGFDSNRVSVSVGRLLTPRSWLELGYVNVYSRGAPGRRRSSHVVSVALAVSL